MDNKNYIDTFIFRQYPKYEKQLFEFIMKADRIDANSDAFADIIFDIKRRKVSDSLVRALKSPNVVLGIHEGNTLPKSFKYFTAKDVKEDKSKIKVFIDLTGVVKQDKGIYTCTHIDWVISYILDGMTAFIYTMLPNKLTGNSSVMVDGGDCFMRLFTYIIDRLYKISSVPQKKMQVQYLSAIYYQVSILGRDFDASYDSIVQNAVKMSDIEKKDSGLVNAMYNKEDFTDINRFCDSLSRLGFKDMQVSNVLSYWMNAFGTGTVLALEYFPSFSAMLTDCYMGGYLNNQITIEKITGPSMVKFTKTILQIGEQV